MSHFGATAKPGGEPIQLHPDCRASALIRHNPIPPRQRGYIADDIHFIPVEDSEYDRRFGDSYASFGRLVGVTSGDHVVWRTSSTNRNGIADASGKVNIWVRRSVLESDRAIVAILAHEAFEIEELREKFQEHGGAIRVTHYRDLTKPGNPGNPHSRAVDFGDQLVLELLKQRKQR